MPAPECFSPEKRRRAWQQHMLKDQSVPQKSQTSKTVHNNKLQKEHLYVPVSPYLVQEGTGGKRERKSSGKQCVKEFCFHFRLQSQRKRLRRSPTPAPGPKARSAWPKPFLTDVAVTQSSKHPFPVPWLQPSPPCPQMLASLLHISPLSSPPHPMTEAKPSHRTCCSTPECLPEERMHVRDLPQWLAPIPEKHIPKLRPRNYTLTPFMSLCSETHSLGNEEAFICF